MKEKMKKLAFLILLIVFFTLVFIINVSALSCSGKCGSGAECNAAGNPSEGKMWSCRFSGGSYQCIQEDINAGGNSCYLSCNPYGWFPCGCDVSRCEENCLRENAGKPGHHTRTELCDNCGQKFTCGCDIEQPICGDGKINQPFEECDDGNTNNNDGCLNTCKLARCGDNYIWSGREQCELPNTINNMNCAQTTETCSGKKTGLRDSYGSCNSQCNCVQDSFNYQCIKGKCGAECSTNNDCNDNNPKTQDICNSNCGCEHTTICVDECSLGETKCIGNDIFSCGNYDSDPCLEWGFSKNCYYKKESPSYFVCEKDVSAEYKTIEEGYCKDIFGNRDYCDSKTTKLSVSKTDCGKTSCTKEEKCMEDSVFEVQKCTLKGCDTSSGKCYFKEDKKLTLKEKCGPDTCVSFTNKDIFKQEYVDDSESCIENKNAYCALDPGRIYDVCLTNTLLSQVYCNVNDHAFETFDCSTLSGCYDFNYTQCYLCSDEYGNCYEKDCKRKGTEYRQYTCGNGICNYNVNWQDIDKDKIDDRCDSCIDVDKDGVCDDLDNCLNYYNPNQIDKDKDGLGDSCDNDRDGDGFPADADCEDWNPKINPGMKEILNNYLDDDCNPETKDRIADTPREIIYLDVQTNEDVFKSDEFIVIVSITNNGDKTLKDIQVTASFPGLQLNEVKLIRNLEKESTVIRLFTFNMPKIRDTYEYLRVSVTAGDYKRVIYREIKLTTKK